MSSNHEKMVPYYESLVGNKSKINKDTLEQINHLLISSNYKANEFEFINLLLDKNIVYNLNQYLKLDFNFQYLPILISNLLNFSNSEKFCIQFLKHDGLTVIFQLIKNQNFSNFSNDSVSKILVFILKLAKYYHHFKSEWLKEKAIDKLVELGYKLENNQDCQIICYLTICLLMEHEQIRYTEHAIERVIRIIVESAHRLESNKNIRRNETSLIIENDFINLDLMFILNCLHSMIECDLVKEFIYYIKNLNKYLYKIFLYGNQFEKAACVKLYSKLCLSDKLVNDGLVNNLLIHIVESFSNNSNILKDLNEYSKLLLFTLKIKNSQSKTIGNGPMFIIYAKENFGFYEKLKNDLELSNHNVCIERKIFDLTSLTESKCVLVCVSKEYHLSNMCRLETEYAIRLEKPIIFLLVEDDLKIDRWLMAIWDTKDRVDFRNYDKGIYMLKEILDFMLIDLNINSNQKYDSIKDWSKEQVKKWLIDKNINSSLFNNIFPADGKILIQIHEILVKSPKYFYSSFKSNASQDVAHFVSELNSLFDKV